MRKVLFIACALGLLTIALTGASVANEQNWQMLIRASQDSPTTTNSSGAIYMGTVVSAGTTDGFDAGLDGFAMAPDPPANNLAKSAWYRPEWIGQPDVPDTGLVTNDLKGDLAEVSNLVKVWDDLILWGSPNYSGSSLFLLFRTATNAGLLPPTSIGGKTVAYTVQMVDAPQAYKDANPVLPSWLINSVPGTNTLLLSVEVPSAGAIGDVPVNPDGSLAFGYRFQVITPEPGSMIVLASGLTGLLGLVARRRSA